MNKLFNFFCLICLLHIYIDWLGFLKGQILYFFYSIIYVDKFFYNLHYYNGCFFIRLYFTIKKNKGIKRSIKRIKSKSKINWVSWFVGRSISVNWNWDELKQIIRYPNQRKFAIYFNSFEFGQKRRYNTHRCIKYVQFL